ncbi:RNA polymerase sigma factor [Salinibacillus aidingensis]|uniref:RNA polymerase sigma factor n=1 Tax=Salinibacillus aidingensis TaxID=237684 RepID=A0ABN1BG03_9BACI
MSSNNDAASYESKKRVEHTIEELFVIYKAPIYRFVFRYCQDEQLCLDLVQDTFVKFHKYQAYFDEKKSNIKTYLFRIAYQLMINRLKKRSRMKKILPFLYVNSQQQNLSYEDKFTIQAAIQQLPDKQRAVILLTYYHDLTQKDISGILEIPIGTVKSRLDASLKKLKALLEGNK